MTWRPAVRARLERSSNGQRALDLRAQLLLLKDLATGRELWPGMREPFNGQSDRMRTVRALIEQFEPDAFIETGTFIGSTTRYFCGNGVPVYTGEVMRSFWLLARLRLGWDNGAELVLGDSRTMLQELAAAQSFSRPFAYLDAHWGGDPPVQEEIALLCGGWQEVILVVDDFRVDGDSGFGYDEYKGRELSLDHVLLPKGVISAWPAKPSETETGAKRGTLYAAHGPDATRALAQLIKRGFLREVTPGFGVAGRW